MESRSPIVADCICQIRIQGLRCGDGNSKGSINEREQCESGDKSRADHLVMISTGNNVNSRQVTEESCKVRQSGPL